MMLFTDMSSLATSFAKERAKPTSAARDVFDKIIWFEGCFTEQDVTMTIRPQRRARILGNTVRNNVAAASTC